MNHSFPLRRAPLWSLIGAIALIAAFSTWDLSAADEPTPGVSPPAAKQVGAPGLMVTFDSAGRTDTRPARLAALYIPAGTPPTPFLAPGPFKATVEGSVVMKLRDEITFSFAGAGAVKLFIKDTLVLERSGDLSAGGPAKPIRLAKGLNKLVIQYESPREGDAWFRLYWSASDFPAEPIPPSLLSHDGNSDALRASARLREGRQLFAEHMCASCHAVDKALEASILKVVPKAFTPDGAPALAMPDLAKDAPNLAGIGSRVNEAWLTHWISDPRALRPDATMPRLFTTADPIEPAARDIAAFLMTLTAPGDAKNPEVTEELAVAGGRLFVHLQCVACHQTPAAGTNEDPFSRIPLRHVRAKYPPASLRAFLANPQAHYAWTRMPNFKLNEVELNRLTAFLLFQEGKPLADNAKGDPIRGKKFFETSGCLNCHSTTHLPGLGNRFSTKPLAEIKNSDSGCLAPVDQGRAGAPRFSFTPDQRQALAAFLSTDRASLTRESLNEFSERSVTQLRCNACHARDEAQDFFSQLDNEKQQLLAQGQDDEDLGEEDEKISPDQSIPLLTWAGEKLRPEWTSQFIAGRLDTRYRPWLRARMPAFPARAPYIAHGLPLDHGFAMTSPPDMKRDDQLAEIGRTLVGKEGGFACMTCHGVGDTRPVGVFEAPGPNLRHSKDRLNPHYYTRWVYNPLRVHKDTKMPAFADTEGKTSLKETLDGDARKQYEAIWHYLLTGQQIQAPEN